MSETVVNKAWTMFSAVSQSLTKTVMLISRKTMIRPLSFGLGASVASLILGFFFNMESDDENVASLMAYLRREKEMLEFPTEFSNTVVLLFLSNLFICCFLCIAVLYLFWRLFCLTKMHIPQNLEYHEQRLSELQFSCERILDKEGDILQTMRSDLENSIQLLEAEFKELLDNKLKWFNKITGEFDSTVAATRDSIESEFINLKSIQNSLSEIAAKNLSINSENEKLSKFIEKELSDVVNDWSPKISLVKESITSLSRIVSDLQGSVYKESQKMKDECDLTKIQIIKSNVLLLNSQILFDAALSKFEVIGSQFSATLNNGDGSDKDNDYTIPGEEYDPTKRLEDCLKKVVKARKCLAVKPLSVLQEDEGFEGITYGDFESYSEAPEFQTYSVATDLVINRLIHKVKHLEKTVKAQDEQRERYEAEAKKHQSSLVGLLKTKLDDGKAFDTTLFSCLYSLFTTNSNLILRDLLRLKPNFSFLGSLHDLEVLLIECKFNSGVEFFSLLTELVAKNFHEFCIVVFEFCIIKRNQKDFFFSRFSDDLFHECKKKNIHSIKKLFLCFFDGNPPEFSELQWNKLQVLIREYEEMVILELDELCKTFYLDFLESIKESDIILKSITDLQLLSSEDKESTESDSILNLYYNILESPIEITSAGSTDKTEPNLELHSSSNRSSLSDWSLESERLENPLYYKPPLLPIEKQPKVSFNMFTSEKGR